MVRIRYNVNESTNELISKTIESTRGLLRSRISRVDNSWRVVIEKSQEVDSTWSEVVSAEFTKNLAVAKGKAKRALKELGVHFLDEVRRRSNV
jgi:hypothetical protein